MEENTMINSRQISMIADEMQKCNPAEVAKNLDENRLVNNLLDIDAIIDWCQKVRKELTARDDTPVLWPVYVGKK